MPKEKAIEAIKQHCGLISREKKKFVFNFSDNYNDLMSECMRYAAIETVSEEEDVMSGSEEHYIEKWIERKPYNTMPRIEAEALIRSKLTIVHRNILANSDSDSGSDSGSDSDSEKFCRKDFDNFDSEELYQEFVRVRRAICHKPPENAGSCDSEDC